MGSPPRTVPRRSSTFRSAAAPPGRSRTLASPIARASADDAVLIANPADQAIYYYKEGLSAPQGSFRGYGHVPHAVLSVDRSLRPAEPGTYMTVARLRRAGEFDLAFFLDSPRLVHCFELDGRERPARARAARPRSTSNRSASRRALSPDNRSGCGCGSSTAGTSKAIGAGHDIRLLATLPGRWQRFLRAEAEQEAGRTSLTSPRRGRAFIVSMSTFRRRARPSRSRRSFNLKPRRHRDEPSALACFASCGVAHDRRMPRDGPRARTLRAASIASSSSAQAVGRS